MIDNQQEDILHKNNSFYGLNGQLAGGTYDKLVKIESVEKSEGPSLVKKGIFDCSNSFTN